METVPHARDLPPDELLARLSALGAPGQAGRRILSFLFREDRDDLENAGRVSLPVLRRVAESFRFDRLTLLETATDADDGSVKYLFRSPDGALSEAVWIPLENEEKATVCLSSQVGCGLDCAFCATGRLGLKRNLRTWEMVDAFLQVRRRSPRRMTGAVFMGQGEPFLNYDRVIAAAALLRHPCGPGISGKAITISTAGIVPAIRRFTAEGHPYRLIVSLTSTDPARRRVLMPKATAWPLEELADAIREHALARRQRATIAWVCIEGENLGADEVEGLQRLFDGVPLRFNLIDVNDPTGRFGRPEDASRGAFLDRLGAARIPFVRRYTAGRSRNAACGMLAATRAAGHPPESP
jgi:23S rRNA (adenine2503-C2)-methyltransferase